MERPGLYIMVFILLVLICDMQCDLFIIKNDIDILKTTISKGVK